MPIRVLVVDPQPLVRLGLSASFGKEEDIELVGETDSSSDGIDLFRKLKPDVLIIALRLPDFCAVDDLGRIFDVDQDARIIVLASQPKDGEIKNSLKQGAAGIVSDQTPPNEILKAIRKVAAGSSFVSNDVAKTSDVPFIEDLTTAETAVLRMLVGGMSNKEIAFASDVSQNTVKTHVRHIFEKLGVSDRTSATITAIKRGLVRVDV